MIHYKYCCFYVLCDVKHGFYTNSGYKLFLGRFEFVDNKGIEVYDNE